MAASTVIGAGIDIAGDFVASVDIGAVDVTATGAITGNSFQVTSGFASSEITYINVAIAANSTTASSNLSTGTFGTYAFIVEGGDDMTCAVFLACKSSETAALSLSTFAESGGSLNCGLTIVWGDSDYPRLGHAPAHASDTTSQTYDVMVMSAGVPPVLGSLTAPTATPTSSAVDYGATVTFAGATGSCTYRYAAGVTLPALPTVGSVVGTSVDLAPVGPVYLRIRLYDSASGVLSDTTDYVYTVRPLPPTCNQEADADIVDTTSITLASDGGVIYFTTNGTDPDATDTLYSGAFTPGAAAVGSWTLKMITLHTSTYSTIASQSHTVHPSVATASPGTSTVLATTDITLACATDGSTIYFTTDGTDPDTNSGVYSSAFNAPLGTTTVKVRARKTSTWQLSAINSYVFTVNPVAPTSSAPAGNIADGTSVTLTSSSAGCSIYCRIDGGTPTVPPDLYTGAFVINFLSGSQLKMFARQDASPNNVSTTITTSYTVIPAPPVLDQLSGNLVAGAAVNISCVTDGAFIYLTTDGGTPVNPDDMYMDGTVTFGEIEIGNRKVVKAFSATGPAVVSDTVTYTYDVVPATPTYNRTADADLLDTTSITLACATTGCNIYFTVDGETPDNTDALYSGAFTPGAAGVGPAWTLRWIAQHVTTAEYGAVATRAHVVRPTVTVPSPDGSIVYEHTTEIAITSSTTGCTIYYTVDGGTPDDSDILYTSPITLSGLGAQTIRSVAKKNGVYSAVDTSGEYTVMTGTAIVSTDPDALLGSIPEGATVTITSGTVGASIYYTTDGTEPDETDVLYAAPFVGPTDVALDAWTIRTKAKSGTVWSNWTTNIFNVVPKAPTSDRTDAATIVEGSSIVLSCATAGAAILWAIGLNDPQTFGTTYSSPVVPFDDDDCGAATLNLRSSKNPGDGIEYSRLATYAYNVTPQPPTASQVSGDYIHNSDIVMSCPTSSVSIYFTTDGSTPDDTDTLYSSALTFATVGATPTVKLIAKRGGAYSTVASYSYTVIPQTPTYNLSPDADINYATSVTLDSASGGSIYYTTDGETPDSSDTLYSGAITPGEGAIGTSWNLKWVVLVASEYSYVSTAAHSVVVHDPTTDPDGGAMTGAVNCTFACATVNATIYYEVSGVHAEAVGDPTSGSSSGGSLGITLAGTVNLKLRAYHSANGGSYSAVVARTFTVTPAAPTCSPAAGSYAAPQLVTFACTNTGVTYRYILDGDVNDPDIDDTQAASYDMVTPAGDPKIEVVAVSAGSHVGAVSSRYDYTVT